VTEYQKTFADLEFIKIYVFWFYIGCISVIKPFKTKTYMKKGYLGHFLECPPVTSDPGGTGQNGA